MTNRTKQLVRLAGLATLLAMGVACHGILTVDNPGQIADTDLNSKDAIPGLVAGMSNRISRVMGDIGNDMVIFTGLVTGEFFHGGSYSWAQVPEGLVTPQDDGEPWGSAQQARWVAESGIQHPEDILLLRKSGFSGFLIGELFMRELYPETACRKFIRDVEALSKNKA